MSSTETPRFVFEFVQPEDAANDADASTNQGHKDAIPQRASHACDYCKSKGWTCLRAPDDNDATCISCQSGGLECTFKNLKSRLACDHCRTLRLKCTKVPDSPICARCKEKGEGRAPDCTFSVPPKTRGRKPGHIDRDAWRVYSFSAGSSAGPVISKGPPFRYVQPTPTDLSLQQSSEGSSSESEREVLGPDARGYFGPALTLSYPGRSQTQRNVLESQRPILPRAPEEERRSEKDMLRSLSGSSLRELTTHEGLSAASDHPAALPMNTHFGPPVQGETRRSSLHDRTPNSPSLFGYLPVSLPNPAAEPQAAQLYLESTQKGKPEQVQKSGTRLPPPPWAAPTESSPNLVATSTRLRKSPQRRNSDTPPSHVPSFDDIVRSAHFSPSPPPSSSSSSSSHTISPYRPPFELASPVSFQAALPTNSSPEPPAAKRQRTSKSPLSTGRNRSRSSSPQHIQICVPEHMPVDPSLSEDVQSTGTSSPPDPALRRAPEQGAGEPSSTISPPPWPIPEKEKPRRTIPPPPWSLLLAKAPPPGAPTRDGEGNGDSSPASLPPALPPPMRGSPQEQMGQNDVTPSSSHCSAQFGSRVNSHPSRSMHSQTALPQQQKPPAEHTQGNDMMSLREHGGGAVLRNPSEHVSGKKHLFVD